MTYYSYTYERNCTTNADGETVCEETLEGVLPPQKGKPNRVAKVDDPTKTSAEKSTSILHGVAERFSILEAKLRDFNAATNNWKPPKPTKIPGRNLYAYLTAPARLKRLFASPLALSGQYAYNTGAALVRKVSAGWGAADHTGVVHTGLDYFADYGEDVLSCADGRVAFVGYIRASDNVPVLLPGAAQDLDGNIQGAGTDEVIPKANVGNGGIVVRVEHNGDFSGYRTEYYNLSAVSVAVGDRATESGRLGYVGTSGSVEAPHLHLTVSFYKGGRATVVNPTALVPNYRPGLPDSTDTPLEVLRASFINPGPGGQVLVSGNAATSLGTLDRSTDLENTTRASLTAAQSAHQNYNAQTTGQQKRQLLEAAAKYQQAGLVVINAMTFNFDTGLWYLGETPDTPV